VSEKINPSSGRPASTAFCWSETGPTKLSEKYYYHLTEAHNGSLLEPSYLEQRIERGVALLIPVLVSASKRVSRYSMKGDRFACPPPLHSSLKCMLLPASTERHFHQSIEFDWVAPCCRGHRRGERRVTWPGLGLLLQAQQTAAKNDRILRSPVQPSFVNSERVFVPRSESHQATCRVRIRHIRKLSSRSAVHKMSFSTVSTGEVRIRLSQFGTPISAKFIYWTSA